VLAWGQGKQSTTSWRVTHGEAPPCVEALLHLGQRLVVGGGATTEFLEHASFLCLPVLAAADLEEAVKVLLGLPSALLDGGDEVLFVGMAEVARDVGVLEGLQRGEGGGGVQMGDRGGERGGIDVGLCEEIVAVRGEQDGEEVDGLTLCRCLSVRSAGARRVCGTAPRSGRGRGSPTGGRAGRGAC
jgi:hypothetical protein